AVYALSLHDALPISLQQLPGVRELEVRGAGVWVRGDDLVAVTQRVLAECERFGVVPARLSVRQPTLDDVFLALTGAVLRNGAKRSEEHTSELQSREK